MKFSAKIPVNLLLFLLCISLPTQADAQTASLKHVTIDKTRQLLLAYEGDRLVFSSRISTGKWHGSTPNGRFTAGEKQLMHYSRKYNNAPMPFSVPVTGNVFIHGFTVVPNYPASHGCIRVPLADGKDGKHNPAKYFFEWVQPGTPIEITGMWKGPGAKGQKIELLMDRAGPKP